MFAHVAGQHEVEYAIYVLGHVAYYVELVGGVERSDESAGVGRARRLCVHVRRRLEVALHDLADGHLPVAVADVEQRLALLRQRRVVNEKRDFLPDLLALGEHVRKVDPPRAHAVEHDFDGRPRDIVHALAHRHQLIQGAHAFDAVALSQHPVVGASLWFC